MKYSPRRLTSIVAFVILPLGCTAAGAKDIYVAQAALGANTGQSCAAAHAYTFFNSSANWGTGANQIGPGTTVHLCGTITSQLIGYGNGSSGSPITIYFENGANLSEPYCPTTGCLALNNLSYITVNGGTNGVIQSTDNGTTYDNQVNSNGIRAIPCSYCVFENLAIGPMYIHSSYTDENGGGSTAIGADGTGVRIENNLVHDCGWCLVLAPGTPTSSGDIFGNTVYNTNHCFTIAASGGGTVFTGGTIHDNDCHDEVNWDDAANGNHHDGVHVYSVNGSQVSNILIYNNYFHGSWVGSNGNHVTSPLYVESNSSPTSTQGVRVFNNLVVENLGETYWASWMAGDQIAFYNNTFLSPSGGGCTYLSSATHVSYKNNICSSPDVYGAVWFQTVSVVSGGLSNNVWFGSGLTWKWGNSYYTTLSGWQGASGGDYNATTADPKLGGTFRPTPGSSAIQAGANLTAIGLAALDADRSGLQRPAAGSWDIGAYQATAVVPPTGLGATVH